MSAAHEKIPLQSPLPRTHGRTGRSETRDTRARPRFFLQPSGETAASDLLRQFVQRPRAEAPAELAALIAYANDALLRVSSQYSCVVPSLDAATGGVGTARHPRKRPAPPPAVAC